MDKLAGRKTLKVGGILDEFEKDRVKATVDIVELFASFGVSLKARGSGFVGSCPWHEDSTPSLSVDRGKGLYNCFGCGESGDAFTLVQKMKGLDFKEALSYLKSQSGAIQQLASLPVVVESSKEPELADTPLLIVPEQKTPKPLSLPESSVSPILLTDIAERYAQNLAASSNAREYLTSRSLWDAELINTFKLGYADGKLAESLSSSQRQALREQGIFNERGSEHFGGCLVVPLYSAVGSVAGFYGRKLTGKGIVHLYQKGTHAGLVNRNAAKAYRDELIITEAVLDALSLFALGVRNVIPCYGTGGFTKEHEQLVLEERVECVVIAFDADEAGRLGAAALAARLLGLGLSVKRIEPEANKDWNEYLCGGGTAERLRERIEQAVIERPALSREQRLVVSREAGRHVFSRDTTQYRVSGVKDSFQSSLRVGIRLEHSGRTCVDTVDLYSSRSRASFAASASTLGLNSSRVEADLLLMLDELESERDARLVQVEHQTKDLSDEEKADALELLHDPELPERIVSDLSALGYVGEDINKLLVYLAASSRKLDDPISVIVSSQSAAGKSYLIDTVKRLMPDEEVISMTSLSDQALNYLPDDALLHKFLVMGEAVHSDSVEHQIREMLSAKELARLVTVKDERSGEMTSKLVRKDVVVSMVMSTTRNDMNPENASRCFVVAADESENQTRAIHEAQRKKYSLERLGERSNDVPAIIARHQAAQRLLRKIGIVNPYAELVGFPAQAMRTRRDNERFLDLIACVCFVRQYQKPLQQDASGRDYVACDLEDYRLAYRIMQAILPLTLSSFPSSAESLYEAVRAILKRKAEEQGLTVLEAEVTQREIREASGLSQMAVKRTVRILVEYEFLVSSGTAARGYRRGYRLTRDEALALVDLSSIPTPEALAQLLAARSAKEV